MAGDQTSVAEPGRIAQVGVEVAADELHQFLDYRRMSSSAVTHRNGQRKLACPGQLAADQRQPSPS
jgi:hypothetical protein